MVLALAAPALLQLGSGNEVAVLIAAGIAALASLTAMILNLRAHRLGELRAANRRLLDPHVARLGADLFRLVEISRAIAREPSQESAERWRERARRVARRLARTRVEVRYPLWGLDEPMHALVHLPEWVDRSRSREHFQAELLARGDALRRRLDRAILSSFQKGRVPTRCTRWSVLFCAQRLKRVWSDFERDARGGEGAIR